MFVLRSIKLGIIFVGCLVPLRFAPNTSDPLFPVLFIVATVIVVVCSHCLLSPILCLRSPYTAHITQYAEYK